MAKPNQPQVFVSDDGKILAYRTGGRPTQGDVFYGDAPSRLREVRISGVDGNDRSHHFELYEDEDHTRIGVVIRNGDDVHIDGKPFHLQPRMSGQVELPRRAGDPDINLTAHSILFIGYRADGAYVVVTRLPEGDHFVHIGREGRPMKTIRASEVGPRMRGGVIPTITTYRGDFIQRPDGSAMWGIATLKPLNRADYLLRGDEEGYLTLVWM